MAWSRVQGADSGNSGGSAVSTRSVTLSAVGSGNAICGTVTWGGNGGTNAGLLTSVDDDQGNTYNLEAVLLNIVDDQYFCAFSRTNIVNGPVTITAHFSSADAFIGIGAEEFSGGSTASSDERDGHTGQYQASAGTGTDAVTSGTVTTTVNGDLLWGSVGPVFGAGISAGTGFTLGLNPAGEPVTEWRTQTTAGAGTAATATASASNETCTFLIALKPPAGAAAKTPYNPWPQAAPVLGQ